MRGGTITTGGGLRMPVRPVCTRAQQHLLPMFGMGRPWAAPIIAPGAMPAQVQVT